MAKLLYAKKAGGMSSGFKGGNKSPTKAAKSSGGKPAKSAAKAATSTSSDNVKRKKRKPRASTGSKVAALSPTALGRRLNQGRSRHHSLVKTARPALSASVLKNARRYYHKSRREDPRLRIYDKNRSANLRRWKKAKGWKPADALYKKGHQAGRRPRAGHTRKRPVRSRSQ